MTAADFIQLAGKLAAIFHDPASCRTIVGRAYYGGFHLAKAFLEGLDIRPPRNANIHVYVQHCLLNSGNPEAASAGSLLGSLHSDRIKADYDLHPGPVETTAGARTSVERARQLQSALEKCVGMEQERTIREGVATYLAKIQAKPLS
ncbi:MAG: hypothetical protein ACR2FY_00465 [Pirellulaceae bacterium]